MGSIEICFLGRGAPTSLSECASLVAGDERRSAWLEQIHSSRAKVARPGACGPGDALVTAEVGLVCAVVTADCVPLLLAGNRQIAAVHAGWRGLVAGVIPNALDRMQETPGNMTAWIGPAIGGCCYEVDEDVAVKIEQATGTVANRDSSRQLPHIDLLDATRQVLRASGVLAVHTVEACTRCESDRLWSYRRDGAGAGRNVALIWRSSS